MRIGSKVFKPGHTYVMGVINVAPDSFSDAGRYTYLPAVMERVELMIQGGADVIDIGGQSRKPGAEPVSAEEEMRRVIPVIEEIRKLHDIPISIDTGHVETAIAGLEAGADMINDISGFADPEMAKVIADYDASVNVIYRGEVEGDIVKGTIEGLGGLAEQARAAGIGESRILLDPGIGVEKTREEELQVLAHLKAFEELPYPMLLGSGRKPGDDSRSGGSRFLVCSCT